MKALKSVLDAVGNTPIVQLQKVLPAPGSATIFAKLEYLNPGGSIKDRMVKFLLEEMDSAAV